MINLRKKEQHSIRVHIFPIISFNIVGKYCDTRMTHDEIKGQQVPLAERMVREPFWLGLITVLVVMIIIGVGYLVKKHLPEKIEKLLRTDLEANLVSGGVSTDYGNNSGITTL